MRGKRYQEVEKLVDKTKAYSAQEALDLNKKCQNQNLMKQLNYMLN